MNDQLSQTGGDEAALERARRVLLVHQKDLLAKANVVGVGIGLVRRGSLSEGEVGLVVLVSRKLPRAQLDREDILPRALEGVPVDVQEVGEIRALDSQAFSKE